MLLVIDYLTRFWTDLIGRTDGPMTFRFFLQPTMALILALIDGVRDARAGKAPYASRMMRSSAREDLALWREGVTATARILVLGVIMDAIYQVRVYGGFPYPLEAFVLAVALGFIPYLVLRGPFTRLAARWFRSHPSSHKDATP